MSELNFFNDLILAWFILAGGIFIALFFVVAPYGRHTSHNFGLTIGNKWGWIIMESISPLIFGACFVLGKNHWSVTTLIFLLLWEAHYIHRAYIYPLERRAGNKPMPLLVVSLALIFNAANSYLNGRYIFTFSAGYPNHWLIDPRFITGITLFVLGFILNRNSDKILRSLRKPGDTGYYMTSKGFYRWISCPNYLGEIMIWTGWAIGTWSLAGLTFAVWTAANLIPRARAHHRWYKQNFLEYPTNRKALIPGIW